jgi:hypothetical protein
MSTKHLHCWGWAVAKSNPFYPEDIDKPQVIMNFSVRETRGEAIDAYIAHIDKCVSLMGAPHRYPSTGTREQKWRWLRKWMCAETVKVVIHAIPFTFEDIDPDWGDRTGRRTRMPLPGVN